MKDYVVWLALLGLAWVLQFFLSMRQMRGFYRRVSELRQFGRTSIGVGGGTYRGRAYAVVVADPSGRVLTAELMSGISVFARLRPLPEVKGWNLRAMCEAPPTSLNAKQKAALCQAANKLQQGGEASNSVTDHAPSVGPASS